MWIVWLEKKILKTIGIILGILIILITALHFYVVNNAESLVEQLVADQSNGKLKLKVRNIKFNYFSKKVELDNVTFYSNDSLDLRTAYYFQVDRIKLKLKALIPIFTRRELKIDSLALDAPKIEVTRLKPLLDTTKSQVSIPQEMGRIYNSIMDALRFLEVKRFQFDEGQFRLVNKIIPDQQPLEINTIHFHIEDFKVDSSSNAEDFPDADKLVFWTKNQDITFPDGNHRLAFSRFRIKIKKQIIEIDSCTLVGKKEGANQSGYTVFLDTLKLTNVDFRALYENNLIKADSVYCKDPNIKIQIELKNKTADKKNIPNLDTIINQLVGDLELGYIGVKNASLDIASTRNDKTTSFTSEKNNFEMNGLKIDHSLEQPVSLESFDMAIRNYENYLNDSAYILRFDSIRLREKRILLSNFSINTQPYRDSRNIRVQQFVLSGLSWGDLLFDRRIIARQATLFRPVIDYTQPAKAKQKRNNPITNSLASINTIMSLEKINVEQGKISIKTRSKVELMMDDADFVLNTGRILDSVSFANAENSIESLSFKKGVMRSPKLMLNMDTVLFDGMRNQFKLKKINLYDHDQNFNVTAWDINLDTLDFDEPKKFIFARGVNWERAVVEINSLNNEHQADNSKPIIQVDNLLGKNTQVYFNSSSSSLSVLLTSISTPYLSVTDKFSIKNPMTTGTDLYWYNKQSNISARNFTIKDNAVSRIDSLVVHNSKDSNSLDVYIPIAELTPDITSILEKKNVLKNVKLLDPVFSNLQVFKTDKTQVKALPDISINQAEIVHPTFTNENLQSQNMQKLTWDGRNNTMFLKRINISSKSNEINIDTIKTDISSLNYINANQQTGGTKQGKLDALISSFKLQKVNDQSWSFKLDELVASNFLADSFGNKPTTFKISGGTLKNFVLSSQFSNDLKKAIEQNQNFSISNISGYMVNEKNTMKWNNLSFYRPDQELTVDSVSFHPNQSRDEFVAASPWQTDYIQINTGNIKITKFDLDQYLADSVFKAGNLHIDSLLFTSYRDKRPPFRSGIIKPLPTKLIQNIPIKLSLDTIYVTNSKAIYTELNDKTKETADVPVTQISGDIFPIRNYSITPSDTFRIRLNGYLLDTGWIRLRTRESYYDSLSGFQITMRMRPHSLLYLNQILEPLSSVRIQSGYLDTLTMRAIAKDHLALGEMKMYYHDLKVQFLSNGSENKKRFLQGLITFIANSFVIKNKNTKRTGVVYFPRIRDRSFINYYIKIAMSGVASSVGAKKNKRLMRKYKKQLKISHLPPIDLD